MSLFRFSSCLLLLAWSAVVGSAAEVPLTVVSYNIHAGRGMDKKIDLPRIAAVLRAQDPDVVLLQEVDVKTNRSGKVDQAAELGRLLGMKVYFAKAMDYDGGGYGNVILSKHPFQHAETVTLKGGREQRSVGIVTIQPGKSENSRVLLVDVHMDLNKQVHAAHGKQITEAVKKLTAERPATPVIWGGDFNATKSSSLGKQLEADWVISQKQGNPATFPSTGPREEIDWFLYRPAAGLEVKEYRVIAEPVASDHCPVLFKVALKK